jgi:hypothetical protein
MANVSTPRQLDLTDFQLFLLKSMEPPEQLLASSLRELGRGLGDMMESHDLISLLMRHGPDYAENVRRILGDDAAGVTGEAGNSDIEYRRVLPLWPSYTFHASFDPSGQWLLRAGFIHTPGSREEYDPVPWRLLEDDLPQVFGHVHELDAWGSYASYSAVDIRQGGRRFLRFSWRMLQEINELHD